MRRSGSNVKMEVAVKDGRWSSTNKKDAWTGLDNEDADDHKAVHAGPKLPQRSKMKYNNRSLTMMAQWLGRAHLVHASMSKEDGDANDHIARRAGPKLPQRAKQKCIIVCRIYKI